MPCGTVLLSDRILVPHRWIKAVIGVQDFRVLISSDPYFYVRHDHERSRRGFLVFESFQEHEVVVKIISRDRGCVVADRGKIARANETARDG
jgi:hypothetical protein